MLKAHARKRNTAPERLLADVPLDPARSVRLWVGANMRIELWAPVEERVLFKIDLGAPDPEQVRAATKAIIAVRARLATVDVAVQTPEVAPAPVAPAPALTGGAFIDDARQSPFLLSYDGEKWSIEADYKSLKRRVSKEQLREWGFRTWPLPNGLFHPWSTRTARGARKIMEALGARLGVTTPAWEALQRDGAPGLPMPQADPAAHGLSGLPYGIVLAEPGVDYPILVYRSPGGGYAIKTGNIFRVFDLAGGKDTLKERWGFRTRKDAGGGWSDWSTHSLQGVAALLRALRSAVAVTPEVWREVSSTLGVEAFPESGEPDLSGPIRLVRGAGPSEFYFDAMVVQLKPFEAPLREMGFINAQGTTKATTLPPVMNLLRSNIAGYFEVPEDVREQAARFEVAITESARSDGASCGALLAPRGRHYLPYQCDGIGFAMQRNNVLIADEPGLGKTIQALGFINNRPDVASAIVVAPASLLANWRREAERWLARPFSIYVAEDSDVAIPPDAAMVIVNYEKLIDVTRTETDYGPVSIVHEPYAIRNGYAIRNVVSGRRVCSKTWRSLAVARQKCIEFSRLGEPQSDGSRWGTATNFGYFYEQRGKRKNAKPTKFWLVDESWRPLREARYPDKREHDPGDVPTGFTSSTTRPSSIFRDLMARRWSLLIIDEVHKIKASGSEPQKSAIACLGHRKYNPSLRAEEMLKEGLSQRVDYRIYLSGTPMPNRTVEMWPYIHDLAPDTFSNFFSWARRYAGAKQKNIGRRSVWEFKGNTNSEELYQLLRGTIMVRRLKHEVLRDLPPKMRQIVVLPASIMDDAGIDRDDMKWDTAEASIRETLEKYSDRVNSTNLDGYSRAAASVVDLERLIQVRMEEMSRMRRDLAVAKVPYVVDHIGGLLESGVEAIVVMAHHHEVQEKLLAEFTKAYGPGSTVLHTGGMAPQAKDAAVVAFQGVEEGGRVTPHDPRCRIFIGSILASGVGITLTRAHTLVFAELDWVPGNVTQAEDRVHRIGQTMPVLIQHLVVDESLDARLVESIIFKQAAQNAVLDESAQARQYDLADLERERESAHIQEALAHAEDERSEGTHSTLTLEEWAVQVILRYSRDGQTAHPLNAYDLDIVRYVVANHDTVMTGSKQNAAIAVAIKIRGEAPAGIHRTGSGGIRRPEVFREPRNPLEEWAARGIQSLAGMDMDYARERNEMGFSAGHSGKGHELEARVLAGAMTDDHWREAVKIALHYRNRQLGPPPEMTP